MPHSPRKCMGKNVRLNPTNCSQKWALPNPLDSIRPKIFGNQ